MAERIPPPGPELRGRVIEGARRRRRRGRQVATALVAGAALVISLAVISPGQDHQVVKVGPSSSSLRSAANMSLPVPPAIVNVLAQSRQPFDSLEHITDVSLKEVTWREFGRVAPNDTKGVTTVVSDPAALVYVILQTGGSSDFPEGAPPGQRPYRWAINVMSIEASVAGEDILGEPARGEKATLRPSFWSRLPGTEYVLDIATGKIAVHRPS
jgi:hypothetical protein